jgi:ligand-binding sensor domain-containing protein/two-component sensor histidine kinase
MMRLTLISLILFFSMTSLAQFELSHRQLTVKNGLPSNTIFDIKQGADGSILIGHNSGLSSYNGIQFENFSNQLKNTALSNIVEVCPQIYLCRNFNDEVFFTCNKELIKIPALSNKKSGFSTFFWIEDSLYYKKANTISKLYFEKGIHEIPVFSLSEEKRMYSTCTLNKTIFTVHNSNIHCINTAEKNKPSVVKTAQSDNKFLFTKGEQVFLYEPTYSMVYEINDSKVLDSFSLNNIYPENKVNFVQTLKNGQVVFGTFAGLFLFSSNFEFIGHYFRNMQVSCVFEDIENNLWIGTLQDGIIVVPFLKIKSISCLELFQEKTSFYSSINVNDSSLIIGTFNGKIGKLNQKGKLIQALDLNQKAEVQSLYYDAESNELLVFCSKLFTLDFDSFEIKRVETALSTKSILKIDHKVYCGTSTGLQIFSHDKALHYSPELWVKKLTYYQGQLLLETASGLRSFNTKTNTIENYKPLLSFGDQAQLNNTLALNDTLFFTEGSSIYRLHDQQVEKIVEIQTSSISSLVIISGRIYASNGSEIYQYYQGKLTLINEHKGLYINNIISLLGLNKRLLAINSTDIQYFTELIDKNTVVPNLKLLSVKGSFYKKADYWESEFDQNELNLAFEVLPNISALGSSKITFELSGTLQQSGIIDPEKDKSLQFERLPSGNYELALQAINEDGTGSETTKLNLVILKPYYLTSWFIGLVILGMIGLGYALIKWRIRVLSKKNIEKTQKERLKIKALNAELNAIRAQMNPHFIFNCLSSIQTKILADQSQNAYLNLTVFTKLLRETLLFTSKEFISLAEEISFLEKYVHLEQMRREGAFEFKLEIEENLDLKKIKFPSLITQPIIENAILHGLMHQKGPNQLTFRVKNEKNSQKLIVEIEDNGIGIQRSKEKNKINRKNHISFGGQALKERVELLQKRNYLVEISTQELEKGTKVIITIPIKHYD